MVEKSLFNEFRSVLNQFFKQKLYSKDLDSSVKTLNCPASGAVILDSCASGVARWLNWWVLFGVSFLFLGIELWWWHGPVYEPDTYSYIVACDKLADGEFDIERTPGYPVVLLLCRVIFGSYYLWGVVFIQQLCFLLSVVLFWDLCRRYIGSQIVGKILTALYLLLPVVLHYNYVLVIEGESLCISSVIAMIWLTVMVFNRRYCQGCGGGKSVATDESDYNGRNVLDKKTVGRRWAYYLDPLYISLLMLWCISMRPGYIYFIPLYAVVWLYVGCYSRFCRWRQGVVGLVGVALVSAAVVAYSQAIHKRYGYDGITYITCVNNYFFVREFDLLKPELASNDSLRIYMEEYVASSDYSLQEGWDELNRLMKYDEYFVELNHVVTESLFSDPRKLLHGALFRCADAAAYPMVTYNIYNYDWYINSGGRRSIPCLEELYEVFVPRLSVVYLFLLVFFVALVWKWIKTAKFQALDWFLWGFVVSSHMVAILGAMSEWNRLTVQAFPILLLLIGRAVAVCCRRMCAVIVKTDQEEINA